MPNRPLPTISFEELYHVGTMDPADKRMGSYEGAGLSVSLHPEEWSEIARIDGDTWLLTKTNNIFLDAHALGRDRKKEIMAWAVDRGYAEACDLYRWRHYDDEYECHFTSMFETRAEAVAEAEDGDDGFNGTVRKVAGHRATPLLIEITKQDRQALGSDHVIELLLPIYVEQVLGFDGVWWNDRLAPECLSAPRGVIGCTKLASWTPQNLTRLRQAA